MIVDGHWIAVKGTDPRAVDLFRRHYTARKGVDYCRFGFSGNGQTLVLITVRCDALLCWRRTPEGTLCSVFRNESDILSSTLIREAMELAENKWGKGQRFYTYVNPKIAGGDGKCFKMAGWRKLKERTKKSGLIVLECRNEEVV